MSLVNTFLDLYPHKYNTYSIAGPRVDPTMTLSILSSRDADPNIAITLSFNVSFGPPSKVVCSNQISISVISRDVIRSHYIKSTEPDVTRVTVMSSLPKVAGTYTCTVTVESRGSSGHYSKGTGSSTVIVTGKCLYERSVILNFSSFIQLQPHPLLSLSLGLLSLVLLSPGLPHHLNQLVMRCSIRQQKLIALQ